MNDVNQYRIKEEPYYQPLDEEIALYQAAYKGRLPVMVKGPTGCGKSRFIEHMAWKLGKPLITVACNEDMTASDLVGRYLLDAEGTRWLDGPLTIAARIGAICYLDEIVEARQDTTVVIHPLTDHRRTLPLDKKGELISAHPDFQLVISYNPGYQSLLKDLKQSTKQRFTALDFDYPAAEIEAEIVHKEANVSLEIAKNLVKIAQTSSIHGFHTTIPSPGLVDLLNQIPTYLLNQLSLKGLKNWVEYGIRNYNDHPDRQKDYFCLQSADSKAMLQRERHGTLFVDYERQLDLYMRGLWQDPEHLVPYSLGYDQLRKPMPYFDHLGLRIPDVYDDLGEISGIDRYRVTLAHMTAHRQWTTPIIADNFSPFQRIAIEILEDSRVEYLIFQQFPGLRPLFQALHPVPKEDACDQTNQSCIRHRLAMISWAILNPEHGYQNKNVITCVEQFQLVMQNTETNTQDMVQIAISFIAKTKQPSDSLPKVYFKDTVVDYRDDNRHLWKFIEEGDEEEAFEKHRQLEPEEVEPEGLPPRHYPEWDYHTKTYRPDWVSVYEALHSAGDPKDIDKLLAKHSALAKRLKQILDLLKPQNYVRIRYQEEGSELDLDVAIRSLIDYKSGANPDTRINMSHQHDSRNIAVMLLLDLSASLNEIPENCEQTILELSQEAVSLLAWAIDKLGDSFAIAGFHSNTRHEVRYLHIKGYSEQWGDEVKARLANMDAGYSTRMGAAMRHAAHYLDNQKADKKLMLILTDGEPSDVDVSDEKLLIQDARKAVLELDQKGIYTHCISLDPNADEYVNDIFGSHYIVIDRIERLPEQLPKLFISLTS